MGKCKRVLRCYHCGSILQKDDPTAPGYISPESFERPKPIQILYCDHCFEIMKSFNNSALDMQLDSDIISVLDDANASDALILWAVDLFTFNGTLNPELAKKVKKLKVIVMATKFDLFPSRTNVDGITNYLIERFNEYGINPYSVKIIGNADKTDYVALYEELNQVRKGHDVYFIGNTGCGKTTLINKSLKVYTNKTKRGIQTIQYGDTNIKLLEIPLSRSSFLYEVPGISQNSNVANMVEKETLQFITPKKDIKIVSRTLLPGQVLMVGSMAAFELLSKKATNIKLYAAEGVEIKVVSSKNFQNAFKENIIKKTLRPVSERFTTFLDFDLFDYSMENDAKMHDISIEGLCWISFKSLNQTFRVTLPKGAAIKESLSKIR